MRTLTKTCNSRILAVKTTSYFLPTCSQAPFNFQLLCETSGGGEFGDQEGGGGGGGERSGGGGGGREVGGWGGGGGEKWGGGKKETKLFVKPSSLLCVFTCRVMVFSTC